MDPHNSLAVAGFFVGENAVAKGAMNDFKDMGSADKASWLGDWKG